MASSEAAAVLQCTLTGPSSLPCARNCCAGSQKFSPPSVILVWIQIYFHSRIFLCSLAEGQKYQIIQQIRFQNMQNLHLFCATLAFITFKIATICIDSWTKPIMHQLRRKGERSRKFKVLTVESLAESNEAWSRDLPCLLNIHLLSSITVMSHLNSLFLLYYSNATALLHNCDVTSRLAESFTIYLEPSQVTSAILKWQLLCSLKLPREATIINSTG